MCLYFGNSISRVSQDDDKFVFNLENMGIRFNDNIVSSALSAHFF